MHALRRIAGRVLIVAALSGVAAVAVVLRPPPRTGAGPTPRELLAACDGTEPYFVAATLRCIASDRSRQPYDLDAPALVLFSDTPANRPQFVLATIEQVGAVFGVAYRRSDQAVYAAAYQKVQVPFGPGGPGAIYRVDLATGAVDTAIRVPDAGADNHERLIRLDEIAEKWTSRSSLGDIELTTDESQLFVVNLYDRRIYRFAMPSGQLLGSFDHGAAGESWAASARPFGLAWRDGFVYHAVLDSAEVTRRRSDLRAFVYRSRADGSAMEQVAALDLVYKRGRMPWQPHQQDLQWQPWDDGWRPDGDGADHARATHPMPLPSDMAFDEAGNMVLGLRDRCSDSLPVYVTDYAVTPGPDVFVGYGVGDILRGESDGAAWRFDTSREHFDDGATLGDESALGGLAAQTAQGLIAAGAYVTERNDTGPGVYWFGSADGRRRGAEIVGDPLGIDPFRLSLKWADTAYAHNEQPQAWELRGPGTVGDIEILCAPDLPPSPTPTAPPTATPTATSSPTATEPVRTPPPLPTLSRTPTPTATSEPRPAYVPLVLRESCDPERERADVVLVVDTSSSMRSGKLADAKAAARLFVALMDLGPGGDQVALVRFDSEADLVIGLSGDRAAIGTAIDGLASREGTHIDQGLRRALAELASERRRPANLAVIVLLTDGIHNGEPGAEQVAADAARASGVRLYVIGLGADVDARALLRLAADPGRYYFAPDAADLTRIYGEIARDILCPPEQFWAQR